jgi:hypothetical protein
MRLTVAYRNGLANVPNKQDTDFKLQAVFMSVREVPLLKKQGLRNAACCHYRNVFYTDIIRRAEQPHSRFVTFNHLDDF